MAYQKMAPSLDSQQRLIHQRSFFVDCRESRRVVTTDADYCFVYKTNFVDEESASTRNLSENSTINTAEHADHRRKLNKGSCTRKRRVRELASGNFWEREEIQACWVTTYRLGLYSEGHLFWTAIPTLPNCPIIATDAGVQLELDDLEPQVLPNLQKTFSIVDDLPEDMLFFDHEMPLNVFALARISKNKKVRKIETCEKKREQRLPPS